MSVSAVDNGEYNIVDYAPTPVRTGYTLTGWAYDSAGTEPVGANDNVDVNDTIYAVWEVIDYDITYVLDGGTNGVGNPATFDVTDLPLVLADATKDANTFGGWFTDSELTTELANGTITTVGDITLYAKFTLT